MNFILFGDRRNRHIYITLSVTAIKRCMFHEETVYSMS